MGAIQGWLLSNVAVKASCVCPRCRKSPWVYSLRGKDLNLRPPGYEPGEPPDCSTPRAHSTGPFADGSKRVARRVARPAAKAHQRDLFDFALAGFTAVCLRFSLDFLSSGFRFLMPLSWLTATAAA